MAKQIRKKFIGDDQVDSLKIKLLKDQSIRGTDSNDNEVELLKLGSYNEVLSKGQEIAFKSQVEAEEAARIAADDLKVNRFGDMGMTGSFQINSTALTEVDGVEVPDFHTFISENELTITDVYENDTSTLTTSGLDIDSGDGTASGYYRKSQAKLTRISPTNHSFDIDLQPGLIVSGSTFVDSRFRSEGGILSLTKLSDNTPVMPTESSHVTTKAYVDQEVAALDARIDTLQSVQWHTEKFVVDAAMIAAGSLTLSQTPVAGSVVAFVDRLAIFEGASEDFTMSDAVMSFENSLLPEGNQALQIGDEIRVKYQA